MTAAMTMTTTLPNPHRLLVIDDSSTIRKLVELSLRGAPFALEFATTGAEGVTKALQGPDLILLDYVLPDMKAADVCHRLTEDPRGRGARIILMSAKDRDSLKGTFQRYPQVIDFVGKPFTADEVLARVQAAVSATPSRQRANDVQISTPAAPVLAAPAEPTLPSTAAGLGAKETEAAAKALYVRLARPLGGVPEWVRQASAATMAPAAVPAFIARKLLTPDVVGSLLEALRPFYKAPESALGVAPPAPAPNPDEGAPLRAQLAGWPLASILSFVGQSGRTGELQVRHGSERLLLHVESGEIVLASSFDPTSYAAEGGLDLGGVPAEARAQAESEQRASATPLYVTLAERGLLATTTTDLATLLHDRGVRLLQKARAAASVEIVWRDRAPLPAHALGWGRHVSITHDVERREAEPSAEPTVAQLNLERLRKPSAWHEIDAHLPGPEQCFDRAAGFSQRIRGLHLTASEQRVLALVDRASPVKSLTQRSSLPAREVARIVYRLAEIELITSVSTPTSVASATSGLTSTLPSIEPAARPVMILDPDDEGFCRPLREMLARRPRPVPLVDLSGELDLADAISRERPGLVVLNETPLRGKLEDIARAVRAAPHLSGTALAAVLEGDTDASADALVAAGFDAVWTKPVHYLDLVSLLAVEPTPGAPPPSHSVTPSRT